MSSGTERLDWSLQHYSIGHLIASGHFGTVYQARHTPSGRDVALKLIPLHGPDSDEKVAAERHGALLQQRFGAAHPQLVPEVFEHLAIAPFYAIAMELVQGRQLTGLIAEGPVPPRHAAGIALAIASFLEKAHRFETDIEGQPYARVVHADLKPDHILITPEGGIRVLDFGIAKALSARTLVTTNKWGSVQYASPERLQSDGQVNEHADFWSLGVMLFEMLAGYRPYRRYEHNASLLDNAIRRQEAREPLPGDVDAALAGIMHKLLAPQPERRYQQASAIAQDLDAYLRGGPTHAGLEHAQASQATVRIAPRPATAAARGGRAPAPAAPKSSAPAPGAPPTSRNIPTEPLPVRNAPPPLPPAPVRTADVAPRTAPAMAGPLVRRPPFARLRRAARAAGIALLLLIVIGEGLSVIRGQRLRVRVPVLDTRDVPAVRQEYERIASGGLLGIGRLFVAGALTDRLVDLADRTIADFREEQPVVAEGHWREARQALDLAAMVAPAHRGVASRRAYVRGQLARISRDYRDAIQFFREAARLEPGSYDPYLGLASVYAYGEHDLTGLTRAIDSAERLGYKSGRRERAEFGDLHKTLADKARAEARRASGPTRIEAYERAAGDYTKCIEYFDGLRMYDSERNLATCRSRLTEVQAQLPPRPLDAPLTGNEL